MKLKTFLSIVTIMLLIGYIVGNKKNNKVNIDKGLVLSISPLSSELDVNL
ncbi:MAG: hypothetical protein IH595_10975 [Bacteroidales bacterium]|nr:hypothetical protein [Bacteroidales bacterium]